MRPGSGARRTTAMEVIAIKGMAVGSSKARRRATGAAATITLGRAGGTARPLIATAATRRSTPAGATATAAATGPPSPAATAAGPSVATLGLGCPITPILGLTSGTGASTGRAARQAPGATRAQARRPFLGRSRASNTTPSRAARTFNASASRGAISTPGDTRSARALGVLTARQDWRWS